MLIYNYLFYQVTRLSSGSPRHWAFFIIGLIQGAVMFTILKIILIETYDYQIYQKIFKKDVFIIYWTILMLPVFVLDIFHFKENKIETYKQRWIGDSTLAVSLKVVIILGINFAAFLYLDDLFNLFRNYW